MLPGVAVAFVVAPKIEASIARSAVLALLSVCLVVLANYAINELFDAPHDRFHPVKSGWPGAQQRLDARLVPL